MPDSPDTTILEKSVTANDLTVVKNGAIINVIVPFYAGFDRVPLPPVPPPFWTYQRDAVLRNTIHQESMWAAAVGIAISKMVSKTWEVKSPVNKRAKDGQELLLNADGMKIGWVGFLSKTLRDYLTTDNGCFIEIIRSNSSIGSQIVGLRHLDSMRCIRTGDPNIPIIFRDRRGQLHEMKDHQVMMFSDMPDPGETYYGVGQCAASRAYWSIYKLASIEWYLREKVGGLHPLAIHIVNGVLDPQIKGAVDAAKQEQVSRGVAAYMGAVIIGLPQEQKPELVTIPLAELPDRFERKTEFDISVLTYADNLGLDTQDLQPLSGSPLGTGTQSEVLHDKAKAKGLVAFQKDLTHALNNYVLAEETEFWFIEKDYRDMSAKAAVSNALADVASKRITQKITTPLQELQLLVEADELPKEFLPKKAVQTDTSVSDEEKPEDEDRQGSQAVEIQATPVEAQTQLPGKDGEPPKDGKIKIIPPKIPGQTAAQDQAQLQDEVRRVQAQQSQIAMANQAQARENEELEPGKVTPGKAKKLAAQKKEMKPLNDTSPEARKRAVDLLKKNIRGAMQTYHKHKIKRKIKELAEAEEAPFLGAEKGGPGSGNWGHAGRVGEVGGSTPTKDIREGAAMSVRTGWNAEIRAQAARAGYNREPKSLEEATRFFTKKHMDDSQETAEVWIEEGGKPKRVVQNLGSKDSVKFSDADMAQMAGGILIHNHPSGGCLSNEDMAFACEVKLKEIVAVGQQRDLKKKRMFIFKTDPKFNYANPEHVVELTDAIANGYKLGTEKYREFFRKTGNLDVSFYEAFILDRKMVLGQLKQKWPGFELRIKELE